MQLVNSENCPHTKVLLCKTVCSFLALFWEVWEKNSSYWLTNSEQMCPAECYYLLICKFGFVAGYSNY